MFAMVFQVAFFVGLLGLILWPLELLWPKHPPLFTPRVWAGDLAWLLGGALCLRFFVQPVLTKLSALLPENPPTSWRLMAGFCGAELLSYAVHRAMHEVPWLWPFHAVHHTPRQLDWTKAWRQHPVDVTIHAVAVALPGILLGAPLSQLATVVILRRVWTGFLHTNVRLRLGPLEHLIATPQFHHTHHSHTPRLHNSNYASTFPWIDRLFGTWRRGDT